jgi:flavodoxin I
MKILITFGTLTGNTELVASHIAEQIEQAYPEIELDLKNQFEVLPPSLLEYDLILVGASSWGDDESNPITDEFVSHLKDQKPELAGKPVAIFALGETIYNDFCAAARILEAVFKDLGATLAAETYKIDGFPTDAILEEAWDWAKPVIESIRSAEPQ